MSEGTLQQHQVHTRWLERQTPRLKSQNILPQVRRGIHGLEVQGADAATRWKVCWRRCTDGDKSGWGVLWQLIPVDVPRVEPTPNRASTKGLLLRASDKRLQDSGPTREQVLQASETQLKCCILRRRLATETKERGQQGQEWMLTSGGQRTGVIMFFRKDCLL